MRIRIIASGICFLLFSLGTIASAQEYSLLVKFKFITKTRTLEFVRATLVQGEAPVQRFQPPSGYTLRLFSSEHKELYSTRFVVPDLPEGSLPQEEWFNKKGEQIIIPKLNKIPAVPEVKEIPLSLMVPYIEGSKTLEVYGPQNTKIITAVIPSEDALVKDFVIQEEKIQRSEVQQEERVKEQVPAKKEEAPPSPVKRDLFILLLGIVGLGGVGLIIWAVSTLRKK